MDKDRIAGSAKDFTGRVEAAAGQVAGDLRTEAAGLARETAGTAQNLYGQAKDAAREASDAAASYTKYAYENGSGALHDVSKTLEQKVQANPLGSLVMAGVVGFALALFLKRPSPPPRRWRYYS